MNARPRGVRRTIGTEPASIARYIVRVSLPPTRRPPERCAQAEERHRSPRGRAAASRAVRSRCTPEVSGLRSCALQLPTSLPRSAPCRLPLLGTVARAGREAVGADTGSRALVRSGPTVDQSQRQLNADRAPGRLEAVSGTSPAEVTGPDLGGAGADYHPDTAQSAPAGRNAADRSVEAVSSRSQHVNQRPRLSSGTDALGRSDRHVFNSRAHLHRRSPQVCASSSGA
jgi:hypothetical protein